MMAPRRLKTDPPERLEPEARARLLKWTAASFPSYQPHLGRLWHICRDWHLKHGEQAVDWEAAFRNWIRKQQGIDARQSHVRAPARAAAQLSGAEKLGDLLKKEGL